jgi:uncharacterized protein
MPSSKQKRSTPGRHQWIRAAILVTAGVMVAAAARGTWAKPSSYADSIRTWQADRQERLRSKTGWLTVAGLFWLEPGENTFGSAPDNRIVLPDGSAPARAGSFVLEVGADGRAGAAGGATTGGEAATNGGTVTLRADPGAEVKVGDSLATIRALAGDDTGKPDVVSLGRLSLFVIRRGGKAAIRMKDPESPILKAFRGLEYFPIDRAWRVSAEFTPFSPPASIPVPNILGFADSMRVPGRLTFTLKGRRCTLLPVQEDPADSTLFIIFRDETTGTTTYGGGRFLYADPPRGGRVVLDFNLAYNPPCALNPYTTCPLPPEGNDLRVAVRAGEKTPPGH